MKVSIVGAGYVGLVTGVCLAEKGHDVTCVEIDPAKVEAINGARAPIHELGLDDLLLRNVGRRLRATTELAPAVVATDLTLMATPTPSTRGEIDLSFVRRAATQVGAALAAKPGYHAVVVKSTVVPGTTDDVVRPQLEAASGRRAGADLGVGMNPEFLSEGQAVADFMAPDRIVLGGWDEKTLGVLEDLYAPFPGAPRVRTNNRTAEMIKYASNSLLATLISFSNEIGNLCASLGGVDVVDVMEGVHLMRELSLALADGGRARAPITSFLAAGCGYGGSCLPKDVQALIAHGRKAGESMRILDAVVAVNRDQPERILAILQDHFPSLRAVEIAVLGLAFKPGTDDMRESPAVPIIEALLRREACVRAYDPAAAREARRVFSGTPVVIASSAAEAVHGAEAVVIVTRWAEFAALPDWIGDRPQPLVVDARRMLPAASVSRYAGVGRSARVPPRPLA